MVIGDILEREGRQTEAEVNQSGAECLFVHLGVTSESGWQRAVYHRQSCGEPYG